MTDYSKILSNIHQGNQERAEAERLAEKESAEKEKACFDEAKLDLIIGYAVSVSTLLKKAEKDGICLDTILRAAKKLGEDGAKQEG